MRFLTFAHVFGLIFGVQSFPHFKLLMVALDNVKYSFHKLDFWFLIEQLERNIVQYKSTLTTNKLFN